MPDYHPWYSLKDAGLKDGYGRKGDWGEES